MYIVKVTSRHLLTMLLSAVSFFVVGGFYWGGEGGGVWTSDNATNFISNAVVYQCMFVSGLQKFW